MGGASASEVFQHRANIVLIVAFLLLLWMPTADALLHLDHAPAPDENRALAEFPQFKFHVNLRHNSALLVRYQDYFNDHFGFRRLLVHLAQEWKWAAFRDMQSEAAIAGKADWLFYSDRRMVHDLQGTHPFDDAALAHWKTLLTARRDWLRARDIRYLLVVPPDKHSIYPEYLPDWLTASTHPPRRIDQFFAYMKTHSDVPVLDLRDALLGAKTQGRVYYMTDTHWNDRGAYAAYRQVMDAIAATGGAGTLLSATDLEEKVADSPGRDLARLVGQQARLLEKGYPIFVPKASLPPPTCRMDAAELTTKWLPGTEACIYENAARSGRLVIFHDSFIAAMIPFLSHSFERVALAWRQNWDKGLIERENPDVVIDEMLERLLIWRDPLELISADEQPGRVLQGN